MNILNTNVDVGNHIVPDGEFVSLKAAKLVIVALSSALDRKNEEIELLASELQQLRAKIAMLCGEVLENFCGTDEV